MFRAQSSPMDDAVVKATDENLTSENWEYILDVCDRVSATSSGPAQATAALIKRLAHRNANVQLYTLELAHALAQNCGLPLHRELASKAFTDALRRLAADRTTHAQVKQKVVERMATWSDDFRPVPELGIMEQAYHKLKVQQPALLPPPSKPVKREISSDDRRKEEEELQLALALSIKDKGPDIAADPANCASATAAGNSDGGPKMNQPRMEVSSQSQSQQGTTAATVSRVRALFDFTPSEPGELAFRKNDVIAVLESVYKDWWKGSLRGETGIFPLNYVEKLQDPTREELERDAQMEADVFGEIKNVEKLLALLSVGGEGGGRRGEREEDEITELYQRTLGIRPKLIELIARYSQKKDDFTQLNEKFIKARRDYEALLESSMTQPSYQQQYPVRQQAPYQHAQTGYGAAIPVALHGYPSQQALAQQDSQRYCTPAQADHMQHTSGFKSQTMLPTGGQSSASAPFHFIPQGPDEKSREQPPPSDAYTGFQGQIRPNAIHTLNSGNPQELATGGYESPVENRHSYASDFHSQQQHPPRSHSYDQSRHAYAGGTEVQVQHGLQQQQHQQPQPHRVHRPTTGAPQQASGPVHGVSTSPLMQSEGTGPYQAYHPSGQQRPLQSGGSEGDPGDFYR